MVGVVTWGQLALLVVLLLGTSQTIAREVSQGWLKQLLEAAHNTNFTGQTVVLKDRKINSFAVYHGVFDGEVWERVVSLSGPQGEVIRKGDEVICLSSDRAPRISARANLGKLDALQKKLGEVTEFYSFEVPREQRIANRDTVLVNARPLDEHRFGYRLWIDKEKGVLLKMETVSPLDEVLETFEYVSISFQEQADKKDFEPKIARGLARELTLADGSAAETSAAIAYRRPGWLPPGFIKVREASSLPSKPGVQIEMYTDGLAAFTIFQKAAKDDTVEMVQTIGATVAVDRAINKTLITVVGEVPLPTAREILYGMTTRP